MAGQQLRTGDAIRAEKGVNERIGTFIFQSPLWDLLMLQLLWPIFPNLLCLFSTFHLEYIPRYFLDFVSPQSDTHLVTLSTLLSRISNFVLSCNSIHFNQGRSAEETKDTMLFVAEGWGNVLKICKFGIRCQEKKRNVLGDTQYGIHCNRNYDILVRFMAFKNFQQAKFIVVFKVLIFKKYFKCHANFILIILLTILIVAEAVHVSL